MITNAGHERKWSEERNKFLLQLESFFFPDIPLFYLAFHRSWQRIGWRLGARFLNVDC